MKNIGVIILLLGLFIILPLESKAKPFEIKKSSGRLTEKVKRASENIVQKNSNGFRVPTDGQLKAWRFIVGSILNNRPEDAQKMISQLSFPYEISQFTDTDSKREYILLEEKIPLQAGWGFFVFDLQTKNDLVLEIPHPVFDGNTEFQGIDAFLQTGARAFLLAGAHRRANTEDTPCTQPKSSDPDANYPVSDVAHAVGTPFHVVHETLVKLLPATIAVQLHGMAERDICPNAFMSTGSKMVTTNSQRLLECLHKNGVETELYDGKTSCPLNALSNVQGRFSNGETENPCQKNVKNSPEPGNFIHIEQETSVRKDKKSWQPVIEALKCAFPQN